ARWCVGSAIRARGPQRGGGAATAATPVERGVAAPGPGGPCSRQQGRERMSEALKVINNTASYRFEVTMGSDTAFAEYRLGEGEIVLPHTVAPDAFKGMGVGGMLAKAALGHARANGLKVIPTCTFMAGYIAKHPEWLDIVREDYRAGLGG